MNFIGLDIETAPNPGSPQEYALQPWRAREGTARITSVALAKSSGQSKLILPDVGSLGVLAAALKGLTGPVVTWNGVFDVAWLYAEGYDVSKIKWLDAMLLWKWVENSQRTEYGGHLWSLAAGVKHWLKDEPWAEWFIEMKKTEHDAGDDDAYWETRAKYDALATVLIAEKCWELLTPQQRNACKIEGMCIFPVAKSWVEGIPVDVDYLSDMVAPIQAEMEDIEWRLGVHVQPTDKDVIKSGLSWFPAPVLRSPKKTREMLYESWGLPVNKDHLTDTGLPGTSKAALTFLADHPHTGDKIVEILRWKKLNTQLTKFVYGGMRFRDYLGKDTMHPSPKIASTYTGRMTYTSKLQKKYHIGLALHQAPRGKEIRSAINARPGKLLVEFDAAGQEMRLMAALSGDHNLLKIFSAAPPYDDAHSFTGSRVAGMSFEDFIKAKEAGNEAVVGPQGYRYLGKYCNLSFQYRAGDKTSKIKARVDYGIRATFRDVKRWKTAYFSAYPGIKEYWAKAIYVAKQKGYAETLAGRRFYLTDWHGHDWQTGSSAINFPIQGSGADMKELALAMMAMKFPEFEFAWDLHDGEFFWLDDTPEAPAQIIAARDMLDRLPYKEVWGWDPPIPMLWDASVGTSWGNLKEMKR